MPKVTQGERLAVIETKLETLQEDISEIKSAIKSHMVWEEKKYEGLKQEFAAKWAEKAITFLIGLIVAGVIGAVLSTVLG